MLSLPFRTIGILLLTAALCACSRIQQPLPSVSSRPTPLHFGLYVTPEHNPINPPERFIGYHAATDFEILPGEENKEIPVSAICAGKINYSGFAEGYGGLVTEFCNLDNRDVTIVYGHLALGSLIERGSQVSTGQVLGILGAARSHDTDGNRKHLHLGIVKGHTGEMRGYVQEPEELDLFLDPEKILVL